MSGNFARGFMETFPRSFAMAQQSKQNSFERMMDRWDEISKKKSEAQAESAKLETRAKSYAKAANAPDEAWITIYNWLRSGMSDTQAAKMAADGQWRVNPSEAPPGKPDINTFDPTSPSKPVDEQTTSMMGQNQPQMPPEKPQGLLGSVVSAGKSLLSGMSPEGQRKSIIQRMSAELGISPEEIEAGFQAGTIQPSDPAGVQNMQGRQNVEFAGMKPQPKPNPNSIWNQLGENESQILLKAMEKTQASTNKIESSKASLKIVAKMTSDNIELVKENPAITSTLVKGGVTLFSKGVNELNALLSISGTEDNARLVIKDPAKVRSKIEELNQQIKDVENSPVISGAEKIARAAALFDMRVRLSAYTLAESYQQSGRSLSNEERRIFEEILSGGLSPDKYFTNMQALMNIQMQRLQFDSSALANDVFIQQGSKIAPDVVRVPNGNVLEDPDVAGTPLQQDFEKILNYNDGLTPSASNTQTQPTVTKPAPPPAAIEYLMKNPNLKDAFIQKYGIENLPQGF